jgi:plasmid stabilization system protein ParE
MSKLELSPQGRRDIDEIYDYIARHDQRPFTADKVVEELQGTCKSYADSIASGFMIGTDRPDSISHFYAQALGCSIPADR